jgi:hypothetical protein
MVLVISIAAISKLAAQGGTTTTAAPTLPAVTWRTNTFQGRQVGEVLVNNIVVFQIRYSAARLTPAMRAEIVAQRLQTLLTQGATWQDINVGTRNNQSAIFMGDNILLTITPRVARDYNVTPNQLATQWATNLQNVLRGRVVGGSQEQWPDWTNPSTKIVPIISAGTPGLRLGFAQVSGPSNRVNNVQSVVQIDATFQRAARARIFVPSSTLAGLNRVQGVAVTALLQYGLIQL